MMKIRKAVIPAAGLGTRMLPLSKAIPKEMLPIADKPLIQYMIEEAAASGIEQVVLVTSHGKDALADHFDTMPELEALLEKKGKHELLAEVRRLHGLCEIITVRQHQPLGLGHAIGCGRPVIGDEPFCVLLPDDMIDNPANPACRQLMDVYDQHGKSVVALIETPEYQWSWYGMIKYERVDERVVNVLHCVEKPKREQSPSNLGIVSRYLFTPEIFEAIAATRPGIGGEIQITDAINALAGQGRVNGLIFSGRRYDAGDKLGYLEAVVHYSLQHPTLGAEFRKMVKEMLEQE
jgi:UTP--glucose-1-phosphate uridylyltransferase